MKTREGSTQQTQLLGEVALDLQKDSREEPSLRLDRRSMLVRAGTILGASGALAALALPARASRDEGEDEDEIAGLWQSVVSAKDNSFPPFAAFELYGCGLWLGSGQPDLTPAALSSTLWAVYKRIGHRTFHGIGRFWTYDPSANPTGFAAVDTITTLSEDGKTYHGEAPLQFFDNNGNSLGPPTIILDNGTRIGF